MKDWDDLRYFLAVARAGSIRGAASALRVNHSTVSRRIEAYERKLGVRLFERFPKGYLMTAAGEELRAAAETVESEITAIDRHLAGRDHKLSGELRVTMPDALAQNLLMPAIAAFCAAYPQIELEMIVSYTLADLSRREADVAIRVTNDPPDNLVGRRICRFAMAIYASKAYLATHSLEGRGRDLTWIGWDDAVAHPQWVRESPYPNAPARNRLPNPMVQMAAAKAGMGIAMLPCFLADREPDLYRLPDTHTLPGRDIWILTHEDLRHTARVRLFLDEMTAALVGQKNLLEGRTPNPGAP